MNPLSTCPGLLLRCIGVGTLACFLASFSLMPARGHEDHSHPAVPKVSEKVAHHPTAIPDRIVLTWVADPSNSMAATWRTDDSVKRAVAEITLAEDGPNFVDHARTVVAETNPLVTDLGAAHYHTVYFEKLSPETKYVYRVGDGTNWSEWAHFTTASSEAEPFTFVYFGDAQNNVKSHWSRVIREAYSDAPKASFLLHAGDLINTANRDAEWGEWFYAGGFIHRTTPCIATPGNHEYFKERDADGEVVSYGLSRHWRPTFAFPQNGPSGLEESVYTLVYQGTRIISLNSNERQEIQARWLDSVLSSNQCRWTIITFHHPIYSAAEGRDNPQLRSLWQPLFDQYRVDLVLQGHDHTYARSQLMAYQSENVPTGVTRKSKEAGTVYVVSVSGPKMYDLGHRPFMRRSAQDTQLYQIITVDGDELRYEARTAIGRPYDAFTLRKRPGKVNELIEQIPETPERRPSAKAAAR